MGDEILAMCGNDGYDALKMWEAIVNSHVLETNLDPHIDNLGFAHETYNSFVKAVPEMETFLRNRLTRIK